MSDNKIAKILNYWYIMNIMTQNEHLYSDVYDYEDKKKKLFKNSYSNEKTFFVKLPIGKDDLTIDRITQIIRNECDEYSGHLHKTFKQFGNIDIYVGDVLRESVLYKLIEAFGGNIRDNEIQEKTESRIAAGVFSVTCEGDYVESSVSLSPVLWALTEIKNQNLRSSDKLGIKELYMLTKALDDDWKNKPHTIEELIESLFSSLIIPDDDRSETMPYVICFSITCKANVSDEADPPRLSMAFYADDLQKCAENIGSLPQHLKSYILSNLQQYERPPQSVDLVKGSVSELYAAFDRILDVKRAPMGKWPSPFYPALMQQTAINIEIDRSDNPIFSVNGPPGTGKTTLLKEIIVNNITERAKLICDYTASNKPDDLFEEHKFTDGKGQDSRYDSFTPCWCSLKPMYDRLNDYGIVVASCNNAAVENISKELPLDEFTKDYEEHCDNPSDYEEVSSMFSPKHTSPQNPISYAVKDENSKTVIKTDEHDVYFSKYASALLQKDAWGLLAAPMGKKKNIAKFYYSVLMNYLYAVGKTSVIDDYYKSFKRACGDYMEQWRKVERLKAEISARIERERSIMQCSESIAYARQRLSEFDYRGTLSKIQTELGVLKSRSSGTDTTKLIDQRMIHMQRLSDITSELNTLRCEYQTYISEAQRKRFIFKGKQQAAAANAARCSERIKENEKTAKLESDIIAQLNTAISAEEKRTSDIKNLEKEYERLSAEYINYSRTASIEISTWKNAACNAVNSSFIEDYLDKNSNGSREANNAEIWFTKQYDREREKLFYHALQVQKYFMLSSKKCKYNLITLAQYWRLRQGDVEGKKEYISFSNTDKNAFMPSLMQTLFILVPVVSSTFASIHSMFRHANEPGVIGTLIVDEAGQATPECAVGALYRSRRAMIVGDPKQVEPVVTDELQTLRDSYSDEDIIPYKNKTLSVQVFADKLNRYGTVLASTDKETGQDISTWVGCPLVIHRRCISPMFDISNELSYDNIMINEAKVRKSEYIFEKSQWLDIRGKETGNKNHYVKEQGTAVAEMIVKAFSDRTGTPKIYVISPFTTVVNGFKTEVRKYVEEHVTEQDKADAIYDWLKVGIGTVHKFQGKEADEVFFILGCDETALPAVRWVNDNIVNVAVTRAKQRVYIVGDHNLWQANSSIRTAQKYL